jgi:hypothetical protein
MCRKQPGIAIGRLCEKCDGKCVICDSYVRSEHPPARRSLSHSPKEDACMPAAFCQWHSTGPRAFAHVQKGRHVLRRACDFQQTGERTDRYCWGCQQTAGWRNSLCCEHDPNYFAGNMSKTHRNATGKVGVGRVGGGKGGRRGGQGGDLVAHLQDPPSADHSRVPEHCHSLEHA